MNNYKSTYFELRKDIDFIINIVSEFLKRAENNEFLIEASRTEKSFDFNIGEERFSLRWMLDIKSKRICFETYHWKYEPNIIGNYEKDLLPKFYIIVQDASVFLTGIVSQVAYKQVDYLNDLFNTYFSQLKEFATKVNTEKINAILKSSNNHNIKDFVTD